jgi:hypothetical protein
MAKLGKMPSAPGRPVMVQASLPELVCADTAAACQQTMVEMAYHVRVVTMCKLLSHPTWHCHQSRVT